MIHSIDISDDICDPLYEEKPYFCVTATLRTPYKDRDNYLCHQEQRETLKAESIPELYESMGELVVKHMLDGEKRDSWGSPKEEFYVEFSTIFIEVAYYDESVMKASKHYQEVGLAREKRRIEEKVREERERKEREQWLAQEQEKRDKEEYERLSKKFKLNYPL